MNMEVCRCHDCAHPTRGLQLPLTPCLFQFHFSTRHDALIQPCCPCSRWNSSRWTWRSTLLTKHTRLLLTRHTFVVQPLDIVPVDLAINGILAALAASAARPGVHVYQIGTSQCNPMSAHSVSRRLNATTRFLCVAYCSHVCGPLKAHSGGVLPSHSPRTHCVASAAAY